MDSAVNVKIMFLTFNSIFIFLASELKRNLVQMTFLGKKGLSDWATEKGVGPIWLTKEKAFLSSSSHHENKFLLLLNVTGLVCFPIAALNRWCVPVQEEASEPEIPGQCRPSRIWVINSSHISFAKQTDRAFWASMIFSQSHFFFSPFISENYPLHFLKL